MSRWGVTADSSAGKPLAGAPAAVLAGLVARLMVDPANSVTLLATIKHPLVRFGRSDDLDGARYSIERHALRGARPADLDAVVRRLREDAAPDLDDAVSVIEALRRAIDPARALFDDVAATASNAARALTTALEALCTDAAGNFAALWSGLGGEGLAGVMQALIAESAGLPEVTRAGFADLLETLLAGETIRAGGASPSAPADPRRARSAVGPSGSTDPRRSGRGLLAGGDSDRSLPVTGGGTSAKMCRLTKPDSSNSRSC